MSYKYKEKELPVIQIILFCMFLLSGFLSSFLIMHIQLKIDIYQALANSVGITLVVFPMTFISLLLILCVILIPITLVVRLFNIVYIDE